MFKKKSLKNNACAALILFCTPYAKAIEVNNQNQVFNNLNGGSVLLINLEDTPGNSATNNTSVVNGGNTNVLAGVWANIATNNTLTINNVTNTYRTISAVGSQLSGNTIIVNNSSLFDLFAGELKYKTAPNPMSINNRIELHGTTSIANTLYGGVITETSISNGQIILDDYTYDIVTGNTLYVRPTTQSITVGSASSPGNIALANFSIIDFEFSDFLLGDLEKDSAGNIIGTPPEIFALDVTGTVNLIPGGRISDIGVSGLNHANGRLLLIKSTEEIIFTGHAISQGFDTYDFISLTPQVIKDTNTNTNQLIVDYGYNWFFNNQDAHGTFTLNGDENYLLSVTLLDRNPVPTNLTNWNGQTLTKKGTGTLSFDENNTYTGGTIIEAGTLQIGVGGTKGSITGDVANSGVLAFNRSDAYTFSGAISGSGAVTQIGSGALELTAANSYGGGTSINSGSLIASHINALGTGAVANSAQLTFNGVSGDLTNTITGSSTTSSSVSFTNGSSVRLLAALSASDITIEAGSTTTLASANAFVGNVLNNGVLEVDLATDRSLNNNISGSGVVTQSGAGVLYMTGNNTYQGGTNINDGTVAITNVNALGTGPVNNDATLMFSGAVGDFTNSILAPQVTAGNSSVVFADGSNVRITQALAADDVSVAAGSSATVADGQTWTVTNSVSSAGNLLLGAGSTIASNVDITGALSLVGNAVSGDITGDVTNAGNLNLAGDGVGSHLRIAGNYVGNDGVVSINTQLGDDNSATDLLSIAGNASGRTRVSVTNAGGLGDDTVQGIRIIETGASTADAFYVQDGYVSAGAYEYSLLSRAELGGVNWYLTNSLPGENGPTYTPGLGSVLANAQATNTLFSMRFEDREGAGQHQMQRAPEDNLWIRYSGSRERFNSLGKQLHTQGYSSAVQFGVGLPGLLENPSFDLGLMAGYANYHGKTQSSRTDRKSSSRVTGYSFGAYATWFSDPERVNGTYVDSWLLWNTFHNNVRGADERSYTYDSSGVTASIEVGHNMSLGQIGSADLWVQPQAQVTYQGVRADKFEDSHNISVQRGKDNVQLRTGIKTYTENVTLGDTNILSRPFIELNYIHNTHPYSAKIDQTTYRAAGGKDVGELRLGLESRIGNDHQFWVNGAYADGGKSNTEYSINLGWKYDF